MTNAEGKVPFVAFKHFSKYSITYEEGKTRTWNVAELVCEKNNGDVVGHLVSSSKSEENVREVATTHLIWDKEFFVWQWRSTSSSQQVRKVRIIKPNRRKQFNFLQ